MAGFRGSGSSIILSFQNSTNFHNSSLQKRQGKWQLQNRHLKLSKRYIFFLWADEIKLQFLETSGVQYKLEVINVIFRQIQMSFYTETLHMYFEIQFLSIFKGSAIVSLHKRQLFFFGYFQ